MFLAIPGNAVRCIRNDMDLQGDRVILDVTFLWIKDIIPSHEVRKSPVIFLVEYVIL